MLTRFAQLLEAAAVMGPARVAVAGAESPSALTALDAAVRAGLAEPLLIGDESHTRALVEERELAALLHAPLVATTSDEETAEAAASLAGAGEAAVLLKGSLRTDQLLRAVLDRRHGLRTGRLLSDVLLYEDTLAGAARLVGVTDGGINPEPDLEALRQIVRNAVAVFHLLGCARPKVALLSATEAVSEALPSTLRARLLAEEAAAGMLGECEAGGPFALDNALLLEAARAKRITHPAAGRADILVAPSLEAGNILGKAVKYLGGSITAHVVVGARVPVLIPSRVESAEDKLHSIALGVLVREAMGDA